MSLESKIESLLFVSTKPLAINKLAELTKGEVNQVKDALANLMAKYNIAESGVNILKNGQSYQLASGPNNRKLVQDFLKDEMTGELTRPSLETLAIIAYRGPVTKPEIEQIRGVNCSLILRNLLIRGLVEAEEDKKEMKISYRITFDFLRHLGLAEIEQLPDYAKLNQNENLEQLLIKPNIPQE
ncbi:MAG: SMC-Scp complex subunit ScpB [bacterium]